MLVSSINGVSNMPYAKIKTTVGRKQAMIVRSDLGMKTGKIAAAVCYAVQPVDKRVFYKATKDAMEALEQRSRKTEGVIVIRHIVPAGSTLKQTVDTTTILSLVGMAEVVDSLVKGMRLL